jgi:hypothetical protein
MGTNIYFDIRPVSGPEFTIESHGVGAVLPKFDLQPQNGYFSSLGKTSFAKR